jgi:hypothetical protein
MLHLFPLGPCQLERLTVPGKIDNGLQGRPHHRADPVWRPRAPPARGLHQKLPLRGSGHAVDFTAGIERNQVHGDLISEY